MSEERRADRAAKAALYIHEARAVDLTHQINSIYESVDATLAKMFRLGADMTDTAQEIGLQPEKAQKLFSRLANSVNSVVESRKAVVSAHLAATAIRMESNLAVIDIGCLPRMDQGQTGNVYDMASKKAA